MGDAYYCPFAFEVLAFCYGCRARPAVGKALHFERDGFGLINSDFRFQLFVASMRAGREATTFYSGCLLVTTGEVGELMEVRHFWQIDANVLYSLGKCVLKFQQFCRERDSGSVRTHPGGKLRRSSLASVLCYAICYAMVAILCFAMLRYALLCYATLCRRTARRNHGGTARVESITLN